MKNFKFKMKSSIDAHKHDVHNVLSANLMKHTNINHTEKLHE